MRARRISVHRARTIIFIFKKSAIRVFFPSLKTLMTHAGHARPHRILSHLVTALPFAFRRRRGGGKDHRKEARRERKNDRSEREKSVVRPWGEMLQSSLVCVRTIPAFPLQRSAQDPPTCLNVHDLPHGCVGTLSYAEDV